jgi:chloramphenicol-sensitive protein RarD
VTSHRSAQSGLWYGLAAYGIWGLFPIYWKLFDAVPAPQLLAHRIAWSFVALAAMLAALGREGLRTIGSVSRKVVALYAVAALLIAVNWFLYILAVNSGFIVETSLGYFITPLVNVTLGVMALRERLRRAQWVAVGVATAGLLYLGRAYGSLPWISIGIALSFGAYGLVKKKAPLASLDGLTLETAILFPPAVVWLVALHASGVGVFVRGDLRTDVLLVSSGLITVVPLLLFASAVQRVPLSTIGILQYIAPTIQLFLGVLVYGEPFTRPRQIGFAFVWVALIIFAADGIRARRVHAPFSALDEPVV